jgi:hypothetical protein
MSTDTLYLPVSLGEAIDKLTILDIKLARIMDSRRHDVQLEYSMLYEKLAPHVIKVQTLYESMMKINTLIWDLMDVLRDSTLEENTYLSLCKKTIVYNDIRFRIKNKINTASGSLLKEQKGYKVHSILIELHSSLTSITEFIAPIRYYSCLYDQVIILYNGGLPLRDMFKDDPTILIKESLAPEEDDRIFKYRYTFPLCEYSTTEILTIFNVDERLMCEIL